MGTRDDASDLASQSALPRVLWAGGVSKAFALGVILLTVVVPLVAMLASIRRAPELGRIWNTFSNPVLGTMAIAICAGVIGVARDPIDLLTLAQELLMDGALGGVLVPIPGPHRSAGEE